MKLRDLLGLSLSILGVSLALTACSPRPAPEPTPAAPTPYIDYSGRLQISEVMVKNTASVLHDGGFPDWVELVNVSDSALDLSGWALSDRAGKAKLPLPAETLGSGEYRVVFCGEDSFSLSDGETLFLLAPSGESVESLRCEAGEDRSLERREDGTFAETVWISPGFPNGTEGYDAWCGCRRCLSPVQIAEVMACNRSYPPAGREWFAPADWVELVNTSDASVELAGLGLSDRLSEPGRWRFPAATLAPGERVVVYCDADSDYDYSPYWNTGFSLSSGGEALYLSDSAGEVIDYVNLHDIPINGSLGRMPGENGFFYFTEPTPGERNTGGERRVSALPVTEEPDGVYEGVKQVEVVLRGDGEIHYTLDGSLPTLESPLYTGPLTLEETGVVRAVLKERDAIVGPPATFTYLINEHHTLPVLSVVTDSPEAFDFLYQSAVKGTPVDANIALYDAERSFNQRCDLGLRGGVSLAENKKSLGVRFKNRYGGHLFCDVFGNGIDEYASLTLRVGQDQFLTVFRGEVLQDLALESETLLSQESKYCVLYLNGEYWGLYCLKEDFSRFYYASHTGVSVDSVEVQRFPCAEFEPFYQEIIQKVKYEPPMTDELYADLCERLDIDSLIDWYLFEGVSANVDTQYNLRAYRSAENGNRWTFAFYDLDWSLMYEVDFDNLIYYGEEPGNHGVQIPTLLRCLSQNAQFRQRVIERYAVLRRDVLNNERLLERIDYYAALLEPEIERSQERWWMDRQRWDLAVEELRSFVTDFNWEAHNLDKFCRVFHLSDAERAQYFGA